MLAVQLVEWGAEPQLRDVPDPEPSGQELLLRVDAAGLCRSDLHVSDSPAGRFAYPLPMTLGHEVAGTVIDVGPQADRSWVGKAVVVHGLWPCRSCRNCRRGRDNYCLALAPSTDGVLARIGNGLGHPGGLAEKMLVPSSAVLVETEDLAPESAAPLADAALTAYHAVRTNADLVDESTVAVVVGVGGLGHLALQILRSMGAEKIVAVDTRPEARALATACGASSFHVGIGEALPTITDLGGADLVLDFVGAPVTVEPASRALAPGGRVVMVGSAGGRLTVGKDTGLSSGWLVTAPFWGTIGDLRSVVELARAGHIGAEVTTFDLTDTLSAYRSLRAGEITGRAVVTPSRKVTEP